MLKMLFGELSQVCGYPLSRDGKRLGRHGEQKFDVKVEGSEGYRRVRCSNLQLEVRRWVFLGDELHGDGLVRAYAELGALMEI